MSEKPNNIFTKIKCMKKDGKDIERGRYVRGKEGKLGLSEITEKKKNENQMEETMNNENDWDHITEANMLKEPIQKVIWKEMVIAIKAMKPEKGTWIL